MKVLVKATHNVLPDVNEMLDSDDLSEMMGKLTHAGYDIEHEAALTEIEMSCDHSMVFGLPAKNSYLEQVLYDHEMKLFEGLNEAPVMCASCCETTVRCRLTDIESCPKCGSHKVFDIV
jgi:hypothetical protein